MKLKKVKIRNFRLLREFEMDLENELSLVIGKNNCGKTSLMAVLQKFIGEKNSVKEFSSDDFNIDFQRTLKEIIEDGQAPGKVFLGISLKLFIEYSETDNLANIGGLLLDLDPENRIVVLAYEIVLTEEKLNKLHSDFIAYKTERILKLEKKYAPVADDDQRNEVLSALKAQKTKTIFFDFFKIGISNYF
ncbi:MAG: AAA family ATPase, partial [Bacteroidetes bacterium]|nr:AAA family ATPase [Bacteroidota bacterium]